MNTKESKMTGNASFAEGHDAYMQKIHRYGKLWGLGMVAVLILVPVAVCLLFGTGPDPRGLLMGLLATAPMYYAVCIIEAFTYFPMLGAGGSYLSFVTGNIANLKLPCALNAMELAGVKANSEEGELISTIAIGVSSLVTTGIIVLGVLLIVPLTPVLASPVLTPAFEMLVPALFGGLGLVYIVRNYRIAILPLLLMMVLFIAVPALNAGTVGIMVPVSVLLTVAEARFMYKKGWLKESPQNAKN